MGGVCPDVTWELSSSCDVACGSASQPGLELTTTKDLSARGLKGGFVSRK